MKEEKRIMTYGDFYIYKSGTKYWCKTVDDEEEEVMLLEKVEIDDSLDDDYYLGRTLADYTGEADFVMEYMYFDRARTFNIQDTRFIEQFVSLIDNYSTTLNIMSGKHAYCLRAKNFNMGKILPREKIVERYQLLSEHCGDIMEEYPGDFIEALEECTGYVIVREILDDNGAYSQSQIIFTKSKGLFNKLCKFFPSIKQKNLD